MKLFDKVAALSGSAHTGRALKAAKVLNLIGTVRGAITTVLLASSAIGGAVTVNNVRQDITRDQNATPTAARVAGAKTTPPPTPTPLTAVGLRSDAEKRLRLGLDQDAAGADDLRKVSVLSTSATDALIEQTRQKLQNRFDQALGQIDALLAPASPLPSGTPPPSASLSVVAVNALVQVALADMSGVLFVATKTATTEPPPVVIQTPRPTVAPTPVRTPTPTVPPRTPSPTVRPSATR